MPLVNSDKARSLITLLILIFVLCYLVSMFFISIPVENKDLVNITLGTILGRLDSILSYYFGKPTHSKEKQ